MFQVTNGKAQWVPLTDTRTMRNFHQILARLGLQNSKISLHTFRRSGATLAFNFNVLFKVFRVMAPGHLTVSGNIFFRIIMPPNKFFNLHSLRPLLPPSWVLVVVGGLYIHVFLNSNYISFLYLGSPLFGKK